MRSRGLWKTKYGFYLASIAMALSLGNFWRFPYIASSSGGGAFILLIILLSVFVGLPLLVAELLLGSLCRQNVVGALELLERDGLSKNEKSPARSGNRKFILPWFGRLAVLASLLLLSYYSLISGWVLYFLLDSVLGIMGQSFELTTVQRISQSGLLQWIMMLGHIAICGIIVAKGVQQGLEKSFGYIIPVFGVLLLYLVTQAMSLPGATEALRFMFYPDFSQLSYESLVRAMGHVFFIMSIGFGALVTFGSYLPEEVKIPEVGLRVSLISVAVSILVGLMVFPIVFSGGISPNAGPTVLFESVSSLFKSVGSESFVGLIFFLCLYLAAVSSSLGLIEVGVSYLMDRRGFIRSRAVLVILSLSAALGIILSFAGSKRVGSVSVLQFWDSFVIHILLPIVAAAISIAVGYRMKTKTKRQAFGLENKRVSLRLVFNWIFLLKWVVPVVVLTALILEVLGLFLAKS